LYFLNDPAQLNRKELAVSVTDSGFPLSSNFFAAKNKKRRRKELTRKSVGVGSG
jgi:hypothetical protein